jgi:hypothetical protein
MNITARPEKMFSQIPIANLRHELRQTRLAAQNLSTCPISQVLKKFRTDVSISYFRSRIAARFDFVGVTAELRQ